MQAVTVASFPELLDRLLDRRSLSQEEARGLMDQVLVGELGPERTAAFVTAIRAKPLDAFELAGFAQALRGQSQHVPVPAGTRVLDTCGTGAAKHKTFNVSTASAFVVAAAGVKVAKHGNRSVTRPSGSADVLEGAGARIALEPQHAARLLDELDIVFLHAPAYHPAMKHAAPVRQALGVRTVFNLLGPLCNPAGATDQVVGVYDPGALRPMAQALQLLGVRNAIVLHGEPGFDEASTSGPTHSVRIQDGKVGAPITTRPEDAGLPRHDPTAVAPVPREQAPAVLRSVLGGGPGPRADMVALNAAFALQVAGRAKTLRDGTHMARAILRSGRAAELLERYVEASNAGAPAPSATAVPPASGPTGPRAGRT